MSKVLNQGTTVIPLESYFAENRCFALSFSRTLMVGCFGQEDESQIFKRADHAFAALLQNVCVDHCCLHIFVAEQFLNRTDVCASPE